MNRFWTTEANYLVRDVLGPAIPVFEIGTHLGDGMVLFGVAILLYWFSGDQRRRAAAFVIAVGIAALALAVGLKGTVQLPRPALAFAPAQYPGYAFPSAHALGAAAVYGAMAATIQIGRSMHRYVLAGFVILFVGVSRLVIGVHFLGDVVVGTVLGVGLVLLGVLWPTEEDVEPAVIFGVAVVIASASVIAGSRVYVPLTVGAALGGAIGWHVIDGRRTSQTGAAIVAVGAVVGSGFFLVRAILAWAGGDSGPHLVFAIADTLVYAGFTALVLAVPVLAICIEDHRIVRRVQDVVPTDLPGTDRREHERNRRA